MNTSYKFRTNTPPINIVRSLYSGETRRDETKGQLSQPREKIEFSLLMYEIKVLTY